MLGTDLTNMWVASTSESRRHCEPRTAATERASIAQKTGGLANFPGRPADPTPPSPTRILDAQNSSFFTS
jgi:hypothetical protein